LAGSHGLAVVSPGLAGKNQGGDMNEITKIIKRDIEATINIIKGIDWNDPDEIEEFWELFKNFSNRESIITKKEVRNDTWLEKKIRESFIAIPYQKRIKILQAKVAFHQTINWMLEKRRRRAQQAQPNQS
jgi:hypothetical protein